MSAEFKSSILKHRSKNVSNASKVLDELELSERSIVFYNSLMLRFQRERGGKQLHEEDRGGRKQPRVRGTSSRAASAGAARGSSAAAEYGPRFETRDV